MNTNINKGCFGVILLMLFLGCNNTRDTNVYKSETKPVETSIEDRVKKQIKSDIHFYIETLNNKRFDELIELTSPKPFVNKSLKDYKVDLIKQNIAGIYKQIDLKKIESIGKIHEYKNEYYCKIYCTGKAILNVSGESAEMIDRLKYEFELSYDAPDAIIVDKQIIIEDAYFSFIAISKKGSNFLWKYIEVDKQKEPFYDQIIPTQILDQL